MKFYSSQFKDIALKLKNGVIRSVLLYGPNSGLTHYIANEFHKNLEYNKRLISYKDISALELRSLLSSANLFGSNEIIFLRDVSAVNEDLKQIIKTKYDNLLVILADELPPSSVLRKLYEADSDLAVVPCYDDDAKSVEILVKQYCAEFKKKISYDALSYLVKRLNGDRMIVVNELEKLFLYIAEKHEIFLDDVMQVISENIVPEPDMLCIYFFNKDIINYTAELRKLMEENISAVWVARAIGRYAANIYIAKCYMIDGASAEDAMKMLVPPVFFKYTTSFKAIITKYDIAQIKYIMILLHNLEVDLKYSVIDSRILCENLIMQL
jgi:DNA polymerase-3 subunit delta